MNKVFFGIVALAFLFAIVNNTPEAVGLAALNFSKSSVKIRITEIILKYYINIQIAPFENRLAGGR